LSRDLEENKVEKRKKVILTRIITIILCFAFIAFFAWSENNAGIFHWWHVWVLVVFTVIMAIVRLIPEKLAIYGNWIKKYLKLGIVLSGIDQVVKWLKDNFGFGEESSKEGSGVLRELFLGTVPAYFVTSIYLMQISVKSVDDKIVPAILSIVVLIFALYLVFSAFYRKLPENWSKNTHKVIINFGYIAITIFFIDMLKSVNELASLGMNTNYVNTFWWVGFVIGVFMIIFQFIILCVYSRK
jgi:hypothetical protein